MRLLQAGSVAMVAYSAYEGAATHDVDVMWPVDEVAAVSGTGARAIEERWLCRALASARQFSKDRVSNDEAVAKRAVAYVRGVKDLLLANNLGGSLFDHDCCEELDGWCRAYHFVPKEDPMAP
jgi:hypothetical protein